MISVKKQGPFEVFSRGVEEPWAIWRDGKAYKQAWTWDEVEAILRGETKKQLSPADPARRFVDLQKQGFMRGIKPRRTAKPKPVPPTVACDGCMNWHPEGRHTANAAQRKINLAKMKAVRGVMG
jgi:hypothetical protein